MAYLRIRGYNENLTKCETERVIDLFGKHLLGKMYKHIDIDVEFLRLHGMWGRCGIIDIHKGKCRDFELEINSRLCKRNQIKTIAHELVHLKQFARGEFMDLGYNEYKWKGSIMRLPDSQYLKFPWEVEAYGMENKLYEIYKENF